MENQMYYKDGAARVLAIMRDTFGDFFKEYFDGEPEGISESQLPAVWVSTPKIRVRPGATGTDDLTEQITITLAMNKKEDFGAKSETQLTEWRLRKIILGQDPTTKEYVEKSVMAALRKHITFGGASNGSSVDIDFDVNVRGESTATQEAYVTLTLDRMALVPSRD